MTEHDDDDRSGEAPKPQPPHRPEDIVFSEDYRKFWRRLLGGWRRK